MICNGKSFCSVSFGQKLFVLCDWAWLTQHNHLPPTLKHNIQHFQTSIISFLFSEPSLPYDVLFLLILVDTLYIAINVCFNYYKPHYYLSRCFPFQSYYIATHRKTRCNDFLIGHLRIYTHIQLTPYFQLKFMSYPFNRWKIPRAVQLKSLWENC